MKVVEVDSRYYHSVLNTCNNREFVDENVVADKFYLVFEGKPIGGFATTTRGYLTGFFSKVRGKGRELFKLRLETALRDSDSNVLSIFCIGDFLRDLYKEFGFEVTYEHEWNNDYAPDNWNYEKYGEPKLYDMKASRDSLCI